MKLKPSTQWPQAPHRLGSVQRPGTECPPYSGHSETARPRTFPLLHQKKTQHSIRACCGFKRPPDKKFAHALNMKLKLFEFLTTFALIKQFKVVKDFLFLILRKCTLVQNRSSYRLLSETGLEAGSHFGYVCMSDFNRPICPEWGQLQDHPIWFQRTLLNQEQWTVQWIVQSLSTFLDAQNISKYSIQHLSWWLGC